jgi:upstream activation factor subunit UAF30
MAPLTPSPALAKVIGSEPLPRTEIIKRIWDYIKQHHLQDQNNKRMINADENLKEIFEGKEQVSMFELAGVVNKQVQK